MRSLALLLCRTASISRRGTEKSLKRLGAPRRDPRDREPVWDVGPKQGELDGHRAPLERASTGDAVMALNARASCSRALVDADASRLDGDLRSQRRAERQRVGDEASAFGLLEEVPRSVQVL